jgi:copper chaperone CopZ
MAKVEQLELAVEGNAIHCAGCENRIETVLGKLPGVMKVKADYQAQHVNIMMDTEKTTLDQVKQKLEVAGYPARET